MSALNDAAALELYAAAVASVAAQYPGTPAVFHDPQWRAAEAAIERAYLLRDSAELVAALARYEATAAELFKQYGGTADVCDHPHNADLRDWRAENPQLQCARCFVAVGT